MIQLWTENLDDLWERNKYIATETVLKHRLITVLKYDGMNELQMLLPEDLCKKCMKEYFDKLPQEHQCSIGDLIDLNIAPISLDHNLQCDISDWTSRLSQVMVKDIERSYLDEVLNIGSGWDPTDVEAHFCPTPTTKVSE